MFTSRDYIAYFEQIRGIEEEMIKRAETLGGFFSDNTEAGKLIKSWHKDELHHKRICHQIEDLIEKKY